MLLYLIIIGIAFVCFGSYRSWANKRDARERQLDDIQRRLAEKKRREDSGESETPEDARARRRNNRRR